MSLSFDFLPVIIVGAGRSGTNMLRDLLVKLPGVGTWPCDEINYIWRHHNAMVPHDEFTREHATPKAVNYIRTAFQKMASASSSRILVEKTCANSLRVDFIDAVIPEAKYLFLVRDGRDVVLSAMKRWRAKLDIPYVLKKMPFVPLSDLPYYAFRYAASRIHRLTSGEKRLSTWGPRFQGMQSFAASHPLDELCAWQWRICVERANQALSKIPDDRVLFLMYEEIVANPQLALGKLVQFLSLKSQFDESSSLTDAVYTKSVGGWKKEMTEEQQSRIENLIGATLDRFGYGKCDSWHEAVAA